MNAFSPVDYEIDKQTAPAGESGLWSYNVSRGGHTAVVTAKGELDDAIRRAQSSGHLTVIEVKIPCEDVSPQLVSIGREVARVRGWKAPASVSSSNNHSK